MSSPSVSIKGLAELTAKIVSLQKRVSDKQDIALKKAAVLVQGTAVLKVQRGPKTGIQYGDHRASAPGEAPATDSGNLARNIGIEVDVDRKEASVISRAAYSAALEFGTNDGKLLPRPFMQPSFSENLPEIKELFKEASRG